VKRILSIVGVVLILMGVVWFLQGINVIPIGFMAGQSQWTIIGAVVVVGGIGLLVLSNRRRKGAPVTSGSAKDHTI
jgi:Mg2+ and Co2+ transporter CorA